MNRLSWLPLAVAVPAAIAAAWFLPGWLAITALAVLIFTVLMGVTKSAGHGQPGVRDRLGRARARLHHAISRRHIPARRVDGEPLSPREQDGFVTILLAWRSAPVPEPLWQQRERRQP